MDQTRPSNETRAEEAKDANVKAEPDDQPTAEEEEAAERAEGIDEDVERNYKEATERGANQKGEGRLP